jgi:hypothetical protein
MTLALETLCWEAEAAMHAFRRVPRILWLDEGINEAREAMPRDDPQGYIDNAKIPALRQLMGDPGNAASARAAIAAFAKAEAQSWPNWEDAMSVRRDREIRERVWAERIVRIKRSRNRREWSAVIVGAGHATRFDPYSLPSHLDRRSIKFNDHFLAQPPWYSRTR